MVTRPVIEAALTANGWNGEASDGRFMQETKGDYRIMVVFPEDDPFKGEPTGAQLFRAGEKISECVCGAGEAVLGWVNQILGPKEADLSKFTRAAEIRAYGKIYSSSDEETIRYLVNVGLSNLPPHVRSAINGYLGWPKD